MSPLESILSVSRFSESSFFDRHSVIFRCECSTVHCHLFHRAAIAKHSYQDLVRQSRMSNPRPGDVTLQKTPSFLNFKWVPDFQYCISEFRTSFGFFLVRAALIATKGEILATSLLLCKSIGIYCKRNSRLGLLHLSPPASLAYRTRYSSISRTTEL